jgi:hypothetical protein
MAKNLSAPTKRFNFQSLPSVLKNMAEQAPDVPVAGVLILPLFIDAKGVIQTSVSGALDDSGYDPEFLQRVVLAGLLDASKSTNVELGRIYQNRIQAESASRIVTPGGA